MARSADSCADGKRINDVGKHSNLCFFGVICRNHGAPHGTCPAQVIRFLRLCLDENDMRGEFEDILKEEMRVLAIKTRDRLDITQAQMAEIMEMNDKSYSDIERGKYKCGELTIVLLLALQDDPKEFLEELLAKFEEARERKLEVV